MDIELASVSLAATVFHFAENNKLPTEFFEHPDHVSLSASDLQDFEATIEEIRPSAEAVLLTDTEPTFVASAKIRGGLVLAALNRVPWVQIVEPFKESDETGVADSYGMGFHYPNFERVRSFLSNRAVKYDLEDSFPEPMLVVRFNKRDDELRFTRLPLGEVVVAKARENQVRVL